MLAGESIVTYLCNQLLVLPTALQEYSERRQTYTDHMAEAIVALGFRVAQEEDLAEIDRWLIERAPSVFG